MNKSLEERLVGLTQIFGGHLPAEVIDEIVDLITHREWGVALENLCQQVNEYDAPLTISTYETIRSLAAEMNMSDKTWVFLNPNS